MITDITASVSESVFRLLTKPERFITLDDICLYPEIGQIVIEQQLFDLVLATEQKQVFRQCLGQFSPDYYLAVGPVLAAGTDSEYSIDCGFSLRVSKKYFRTSGSKADRIKEGTWIATMGRLHYWPSEQIESRLTTQYKPTEAFILDMQPSSSTFGVYISWPFDKRLPYDPDVIPFSTVFARFTVRE